MAHIVDPTNFDPDDPSTSATLRYKTRKSEREDVQKKTFTKWMNSQLSRARRPMIRDLVDDMRDGTQLLSLLEVLTGQVLKPERGRTRVHHLNNVNQAIKFLETEYNIKLVNICSEDIVNGNAKLILGLVWNIVLHWQMKDVLKVVGGEQPQSNLEKTLLDWCKECTQGYKNVNITNFTTSFRDGLAFNALFHHFCPDLFDFDGLLRNDSLTNLRFAFAFAEKHLGIEQILDPEDVNVDLPDKKSILIYVMCCFQALSQARFANSGSTNMDNMTPNSGTPLKVTSTARLTMGSQQSPTRVVESLNISPADISSFQDTIESVLVWLLESKTILSKQAPVSNDVQMVKEQFQEHEEFMVQLTQHQNDIGQMLQRGNQLVSRHQLSDTEERQIEAQMRLLNQQWEELRIDAMARQTSLQQALTLLQQRQLDRLADWLDQMESYIHNLGSVQGAGDGSIHQQIEAHKVLQEQVEKQQQEVNSLQNMVVVVDDANSDEAYSALERQLESLGRRWGDVCRWAEEHWLTLQDALSKWKSFADKQTRFSDWLTKAEGSLSQMPPISQADFNQITDQVRQLKMLETEMDEWMICFDELNVLGADVEKYIRNDAESIQQLNMKLQELKMRWDSVVQRMEQLSKEIVESGVELKETKDGGGSDVIIITKKQGSKTVTQTIRTQTITHTSTTGYSADVKRQRFDTNFNSTNQQSQSPVIGQSQSPVIGQLQEELKSIRGVVSACEFMIQSEKNAKPRNASEASVIVENCKLQMNELKSQEFCIQTLSEQIDRIPPNSLERLTLERELAELKSRWMEALKSFAEVQLQHVGTTDELPSSYQEALATFKRWIGDVENVLKSESVNVTDVDSMEQRMTQFKSLHNDVADHRGNFDFLTQTGQQLLLKMPPGDKSKNIRLELDNLSSRWALVGSTIEELVTKHELAIDGLKQYKAETLTLTRWIQEMEAFLRSDESTVQDLDSLRAQLSESQGIEEDIKTLTQKLANVNHISKNLTNLAGDGTFSTNTRKEVDALNAKFGEIIKLSVNHSVKLKEGVDNVQNVLDKIKELDVWLTEVRNQRKNGGPPIESMSDLIKQQAANRNLREELAKKGSILRDVNDSVEKLKGDEVVGKVGELGKSLQELNTKWADLKSQVDDSLERLASGQKALTEFTAVLREETRWQMQLETLLAKGPRPSGDAEELSEELDELENLINSQKSLNGDRLNELSSLLISLNVMPTAIPVDLATSRVKNDTVMAQAKKRMMHLEENIMAAQQRESQIIEMTQWMTEVNELLQSHLDADIMAGDVPNEYESLKGEFEQQEIILTNLQADAERFRNELKIEAADRLQQQIRLLQKHFGEVKVKYLKFQKPPDFDTKMSYTKRVMDEIDESMQLLELGSSSPEVIQSQLDHFMKFYGTMSEIKADVEYVIKTGRQVVEKRQVDFPNRLNSQIDAIKQQYNKLGSQVTRGKLSLEKCLKMSRKVRRDMVSLQDFVDRVKNDLSILEVGKSPKDPVEELAWIEAALIEVVNRKLTLPAISDVIVQWTKIASESGLKEPEISVQPVSDELTEIVDRLTRRRSLTSMKANLSGEEIRVENVHQTSASPLGSLVPPTLQSSDIEYVVSTTLTRVSQFQRHVREDGKDAAELDKEEEQIEDQVEQEIRRLESLKEDMKSRGETVKAEQIAKAINDIQMQWISVKTQTKIQKQTRVDVSSKVQQFESDVRDLESWMNDVEKQLGSAEQDEDAIRRLADQVKQRQTEIETINQRVETLGGTEQQFKTMATPSLLHLNQHFHQIQTRFSKRADIAESPSGASGDEVDNNIELRVRSPLEPGRFQLTSTSSVVSSTTSSSLTTVTSSAITYKASPKTAVQQQETLVETSDWLKETDRVLKTEANPSDRNSLLEQLKAVKMCEDEFDKKRQQVSSLNGSDDGDLKAILYKFESVSSALPLKHRLLEEKLIAFNRFQKELDELCSWLTSASKQLHDKTVNPQVIKEAVHSRQEQFDHVNNVYNTYTTVCHEIGTSVPEAVQLKVQRLNSDWSKMKIVEVEQILAAEQMKARASELAAEDSFVRGNQFAVASEKSFTDEVLEATKTSMQYSTQSYQSHKEETRTVTTVVTSSPQHAQPDDGQSRSPNIQSREKFMSNLNTFMTVIVEKAKPQPVVVGNIPEIEEAIKKEKTKFGELQAMKPSIDALVSKLELWEQDPGWNQNTHLLTGRLVQNWDKAMESVTRRQAELDLMLKDSHRFNARATELEKWITETRIANMEQQGPMYVDEETGRIKLDAVMTIARKLMDEFTSDDTTKVSADVIDMNKKMNDIVSRQKLSNNDMQSASASMVLSANASTVLSANASTVNRFDSDLKDYLLWLTRVEVVLTNQEDKAAKLDSLDRSGCQLLQDSVEELNREFEARQSLLDSLNATGRQIISEGDQASTSVLQKRLDEMNRRWQDAKSKSKQIKEDLESSGEPVDILKQLQTLLEWTVVVESNILGQRPVADDLASVKLQRNVHQELCSDINNHQPIVAKTLQSGFAYLEGSPSDPDRAKAVKKCIEDLDKQWTKINEMSNNWSDELDGTTEKMSILQDSLDDLAQHLGLMEREIVSWQPVGDIMLENLQARIDEAQAFQQKAAPIQGEVDQCNDNANQFGDMVLSHKTVSMLEDLSRRWRDLQGSVELRLKQLQEALRDFGPHSQQLLNASVSHPWERAVTNNNVPYYISHLNQTTHWDHPDLTKLMHSFNEFNNVRFSAYRTSMKLRLLQKTLHLDLLTLDVVKYAFANIPSLQVPNESSIGIVDIVACLRILYESLLKKHGDTINIPLSIDLVLNWLLNVYDSKRIGHMRALSFKVAIALMCKAHFDDKYKYVFEIIADEKGLASRNKVSLLFHDCIQIPKQLGEVASFGGSNIEPSVTSCFEKAGNKPSIDFVVFNDWMKLEPQSMVWIPVMHRLTSAESARHQAKCSVCKETPIAGLRYRCLKCFSFDLCQKCFFSGQTAKSHKLTHPMQEYSNTTTSSEDVRDFTKVFKNKFRSKRYFQKHRRLGYLPVKTSFEDDNVERSYSVDLTRLNDNNSSVASSTAQSTITIATVGPIMCQDPDADEMRYLPELAATQTNELDMHQRLESQARELAEVEQNQKTTPEIIDEHMLIAQYCHSLKENATEGPKSPMQIMSRVDADQRADLEAMIRDLETENRNLQSEYDQLSKGRVDDPLVSNRSTPMNGDADSKTNAEMMEEARYLQENKRQLEARMKILEEHNQQLHSQLHHLHEMLDQPEPEEARILTFPASQSTTPGLSAASSSASLPRREPPSFGSSGYNRQNDFRGNDYCNGKGEDERRDEELDKMLYELQTAEFPPPSGGNKVTSLFREVEQINKAVGTLVTIMTDEENSADEQEMRRLIAEKSQVQRHY